MIVEWTEIFNIYNPFGITFQHVAEKLEELAFSNSKIVIDSNAWTFVSTTPQDEDNLRQLMDGLFNIHSLDDLADLYVKNFY